MATTAQRPAGLYSTPRSPHDAIQVNGIYRNASQRRRASQDRDPVDDASPDQSPTATTAPGVSRGPPAASRKPTQAVPPTTTTSSRSFSQRVRANPRINLDGHDQWAEYDDPPTGRTTESRTRLNERERAPVYNDYEATSDPTAADPRHRRSERQSERPESNRQRAPEPRDLPRISTDGKNRNPGRNTQSDQLRSPSTPLARSGSVRDPANLTDEDRREWAPERSPLQKLELTLNDISKEEKRARVEEAEMLLRESSAVRANRRVSRDSQTDSGALGLDRRPSQRVTRAVPEPSSASEPVRSFSQRRPPEGRMAHDSQLPATNQRAAAAQMPDVSRNDSTRNNGISVPKGRRTAQDAMMSGARQPQDAYNESQSDMRRAVSARQARAGHLEQSIPSNITRAVSLQRQMPPATFRDDSEGPRRGPLHEANASHKAALTEAAALGGGGTTTATVTAGAVGRSNSRKLQKAPPRSAQPQDRSITIQGGANGEPEPESHSRGQTAQYYASGAPKEINVQRSSSQRPAKASDVEATGSSAAAPVGLGLDQASMDQPEHERHHLSEMFHSRPRQTSVSFKQPFDRARPVDEWKTGGIARLSLADMDLTSKEDDKAWWEAGDARSRRRSKRASEMAKQYDGTADDPKTIAYNPPLFVRCGPLLRYCGMKRDKLEGSRGQSVERETWRGSVMIVAQDAQSSYETAPTLRLFSQPMNLLPPPPAHVNEDSGGLAPEYVDPLAGLTSITRTGRLKYVRPIDHIEGEVDLSRIEDDNGLFENSPSPVDLPGPGSNTSPNKRDRGPDGEKLGKFKEVKGHRIYADIMRGITFWRFYIEVELGDQQAHVAYRINHGAPVGFWVPARGQSMHMMFHSCNGFSLSVNPNNFSGPDPLWRDVLNTHQTRPFHVMIGGGDQIYNDKVMVETTHFANWLKLKNPHDKHHVPFSAEMAEELETFYLDRYAMWFSQGLFAMANSQIPMVNIWDDHDIIDGFGSYPDRFMKTPVFAGLGNIAFKYYMLFQHQSVPEETHADEPSWLLGAAPGPYIQQRSRSLFMYMGKGVAFLGLDCRTERKRHEILTNDSYHIILERCRREIVEGDTKHLILLLGVPVAYPRLVWLENVLTSRAMDPIKALGRAGILKGGFLNKFDGGVEILDDLDDHWTASGHKSERQDLINDLQDLAAEKSVRITILGGDVHLAAVGQFYTNPKFKIPKDRDHRYIPNIISSAITNTPPGEMLGDILNKRNKIHHFDKYTDEDMIPMFTHDVDGKKRNNKRLLPRRNWCSIREYHPGSTPPPTPSPPPTPTESDRSYSPEPPKRSFSFSKDGRPANLLRRLSLRGRNPPTSYRDEMNMGGQRPTSTSSLPPPRPDAPGDGYLPQQDHISVPQRHSYDPQARNGPTIPRPGNFQRRPTNLSEKAVKKGGAVEGDDQFNDHINLEGGLDIVINCEVSQKDPAGITTPYRLLVPALFYDGTSDAMHQDDEEPISEGESYAGEEKPKRSGSILQRMGLGGRKRNSVAANQGRGNWGQGSDSGSDIDHEAVQQSPPVVGGYNGVDAYKEKPRRRWF